MLDISQWFYFCEKAIPVHTCEEIIRYGKSLTPYESETGVSDFCLDDDEKINHKKETRNSKTSWINQPWIYNLLNPICNYANNSSWRYNTSCQEFVQFTEYNPGGHYNWHHDTTIRGNNLIRKISLVVQLSNPKEYEGGNFEFNLRGLDGLEQDTRVIPPPEFKKQGSVLVFPSFLWHKVYNITKGTRYSLVMWTLGEQLR
jgi:PKHD-type hydroxylase